MSLTRVTFIVSVSGALVSCAAAQCTPQWSSEFDPGDSNGVIAPLQWFDDGAGFKLYAAGTFRTIGGVTAGGLARWDGQAWEAVAPLQGSRAIRFAVVPDAAGTQRLMALGEFDAARLHFAGQWNGTEFSVLPAGPWRGTGISAARFDADGDGPLPSQLLIAGVFEQVANPQIKANVLAWDGAQWTAIPGAPSTVAGYALAVFDPDADGPEAAYVVLSLFGTTTPFWRYAGPTKGGVGSFTLMPQRVNNALASRFVVFDADGEGGAPAYLLAVNGTNGPFIAPLASFDGNQWTEIGAEDYYGSTVATLGMWDPDRDGPQPAKFALLGRYVQRPDGQLVEILTWDGQRLVGQADEFLAGTSLRSGAVLPPGAPQSELFPTLAIGSRRGAIHEGSTSHSGFAVFDQSWSDPGRPPLGAPNDLVVALRVWDSDGPGPTPPTMLAQGSSLQQRSDVFTSFGSVWTGMLASRGPDNPGGGWGPALPSLPPEFTQIDSIVVVDIDGDGPLNPEVWTSGQTGTPTGQISRRWTGSQWEVIPQGPNGDRIFRAAVSFDVDGEGPLPVQGIVTGSFRGQGGVTEFNNIARFDGVNLNPVGTGLPGSVNDLVVIDLDGAGPLPAQMFACGSFTPPLHDGVAQWTGSTWTGLPGVTTSVTVNDLEAFDPDGPGPGAPVLAIAGRITVGGTTQPLWFWNGSTLTAAPGFAPGDVLASVAAFDEDGPGGPRPPALFAIARAAPYFRRVTASGWTVPEGGDIGYTATSVPRSLVVYDEDGAGPNPGGLYVHGTFSQVGDVPSGFIARWGCPVGPTCSADWDHSGYVSSTDVSEFVNDWYEDQSEGTLVTDFNADGVVNSTDVSDFVNAWFEQSVKGCG